MDLLGDSTYLSRPDHTYKDLRVGLSRLTFALEPIRTSFMQLGRRHSYQVALYHVTIAV
jgi:hypothetical protein